MEGILREGYGVSGLPYAIPDALKGGVNLGFMFLPIYRGWVVVASVVICLATWLLIEKTPLARGCGRRPRTRPWCGPSASTCLC